MAHRLLASQANMTSSRLAPSSFVAPAVVVALALASIGCGTRARFEIVRPALLDASQVGNTFTVQPFGGVDPNASYQIQTMLEQRIANSLNPSIRLIAGGGGVIVTGDVMDHSYHEELQSVQQTCSRSVSYTDSNGRTQTRSENYPCVQTTRYGTARSSVRFVVMVASTGQVIFDRTYEDSSQTSTTATNGQPAYIDGRRMLDSMVDGHVAQFAHVILPWPDTVEVAFTGCGGADGCGEAFEMVRGGNLAGAEAKYTEILGPYSEASATVDPEDVNIVSETLFNRGIIRSYTGSYELGMQDLQRALEIRPGERAWRVELTNIETMAAEQDALRQQMGQAMGPQASAAAR